MGHGGHVAGVTAGTTARSAGELMYPGAPASMQKELVSGKVVNGKVELSDGDFAMFPGQITVKDVREMPDGFEVDFEASVGTMDVTENRLIATDDDLWREGTITFDKKGKITDYQVGEGTGFTMSRPGLDDSKPGLKAPYNLSGDTVDQAIIFTAVKAGKAMIEARQGDGFSFSNADVDIEKTPDTVLKSIEDDGSWNNFDGVGISERLVYYREAWDDISHPEMDTVEVTTTGKRVRDLIEVMGRMSQDTCTISVMKDGQWKKVAEIEPQDWDYDRELLIKPAKALLEIKPRQKVMISDWWD